MYRQQRYRHPQRSESEMAVAMRRWFDDDLPLRHRDSWWGKDDWMDEWKDWPKEWPQPREMMGKFWREPDNWWKDWPSDWPRMDAVMPRVTSHLDRVDRNWRNDPFWMDLYPRWAEPIFKEGIDVQSSITNDERKFAVDIDCYQFKPEEVQVKTLDDTLLIEGRHEDVRDRDNFTKMYFVRKYQIPTDVDATQIQSSIDSKGRLSVEAPRRNLAVTGRERVIPIEGPSRGSPRGRLDGYGGRIGDAGERFSPRSTGSPIHVQTGDDRGREIRIDTNYGGRSERDQMSREGSRAEYRDHSSRNEVRNERNDLLGSRNDVIGGRNDLLGSRNDVIGNGGTHHLSPQSKDGYSTQSYSFHRSESRSRLSPHDVTSSNEQRAYNQPSPRRTSFDTRENTNGFRSQSRGADVRESSGSRSESRNREYNNGYTSDSRNAYRVESPASTTTGILRNATEPPRAESRTESLRSVQILRKTFG